MCKEDQDGRNVSRNADGTGDSDEVLLLEIEAVSISMRKCQEVGVSIREPPVEEEHAAFD